MDRFEIRKMLEFISTMDIAYNPEPAAIFDGLTQGFNVWAIPTDHPGGDWNRILDHFDSGAFNKRCAFVGTAYYFTDDECMHIDTSAYKLEEHLPKEYGPRKKSIFNRPDDIDWLREKVIWVFAQIGIECPPFKIAKGD